MNTKKRKTIIILSGVLIILLLIIPFGLSAMIYEGNFGDRYETYAPYARNINIENSKGVVIISHGLGDGGHNTYMGVADFFTSKGYDVFAYDATGNDESEGNSVKGVPQFLIDLDYAIQFVKQTPDFDGSPIVLFGHSLGGYSVGSVLNLHPDVKAVVMVAGFDKSIDIIEEEGEKIAGDRIHVFLPYISLYERIKFGKYASYNSINGFENSDSGVMIIYSLDDEMISQEKSFDIFHRIYMEDDRFNFVKFEDRGHDYIFYSDRSREYKEDFNRKFDDYLNSTDEEFTAELKSSYLNNNLDKKLLYDIDEELMNNIVRFYDEHVK